jgi:hypothetical protein
MFGRARGLFIALSVYMRREAPKASPPQTSHNTFRTFVLVAPFSPCNSRQLCMHSMLSQPHLRINSRF